MNTGIPAALALNLPFKRCVLSDPLIMFTFTQEADMAIAAQKASSTHDRTPPAQPDYHDEVSDQQLDSILALTDADGERRANRKPLFTQGW